MRKRIFLNSVIPVFAVLCATFYALDSLVKNFEKREADARLNESYTAIKQRFDENFAIMTSPLRETFCALLMRFYSLGQLNNFFVEFTSLYPQIQRIALIKSSRRVLEVSKLTAKSFGKAWVNQDTGLSNIFWQGAHPYAEFRMEAGAGFEVAGTIELTTLFEDAAGLTATPFGVVKFYSSPKDKIFSDAKKNKDAVVKVFPLLGGKWSVEIREDRKQFYKAQSRFRRKFAVFTVFALFFTYALSFVFSLRPTQTVRFTSGKYPNEELSEDDISLIGHELRNPIAAVKNACYFISSHPRSKLSGANIDKHLGIIRNEISLISATIENLLTFLRSRPPVLSACRINPILSELAAHFANKNSLVEFVTDFGDVPLVAADAVELKQAFFNIMENAFDAVTPPGEIKITTSRENEYVRISVKDSGCGISSVNLGKVFKPFVSVKNSGAGLGLAVVAKIIEKRLSGKVLIKSELGAGSEVVALLPVKRENPLLISPLERGRRQGRENPLLISPLGRGRRQGRENPLLISPLGRGRRGE